MSEQPLQDLYTRQRNEAHLRLLVEGCFPMRVPVDMQQTMFEDPNVYQIVVSDDPISVTMFCNDWKVDYWPCLTYDRAINLARNL